MSQPCPLCSQGQYPEEAALAEQDLRRMPDAWLSTEFEYVILEAASITAITPANESYAAYLTHRLNHLNTEFGRRKRLTNYRMMDNGRIKPETLQAIKNRLPLENHIPLVWRKQGNTLVGHCPFHEDRHPSFTVWPSEARWWCFQCGTGGDIFDWLMSGSSPIQTFAEAVKVAAQMAGVSLSTKGGW
jgi:hypothetical protein